LETVLATRQSDTMALQRYDIPIDRDDASGHFVERYWSPVNTPVLGPNGELTHIIHRVEDVTEFVQLHAADRDQQRTATPIQTEHLKTDLFIRAREVQDINRQLRVAYADLSAADQALQEQQQAKDRAKDRFIATLSHELRNPLAAVLAATELLALDVSDHPGLAVLERQVNALIRMTDDLLDASRALTGRLEVVRKPLDLRTAVDVAVQDILPEYARTDRTLHLSLPEQPVLIDGDSIRLSQMLGNLLSNACKYTRPGGTVHVELTNEAGHAVLTVRDDGIGFDPITAERLFEVFARAVPSGMTDAGGLGLGLAIVRSIVELHNGTVSAHSDGPGRGAEFRVRLPLIRSAASLSPQLSIARQPATHCTCSSLKTTSI
jgi:signal transduction histidine kinase